MLICRSLSADYGGVVYSTDDFFLQNGVYQFQPEKLEEYHRNNILRVREAMVNGIKTVVVDNTNIFIHHMQQYAFHAVRYCYEIFVVEPETTWKYTVRERNIHGIEIWKIDSMMQSLLDQGRPTLSCLVGGDREIRYVFMLLFLFLLMPYTFGVYRLVPPLEFSEKEHDTEFHCLKLRSLVLGWNFRACSFRVNVYGIMLTFFIYCLLQFFTAEYYV
uniref:RNase NYN domain-containing protein n=1 Tax=Angiostrongylus cantonensis TaxID=6313 RepID=A0A0K0DPB3_ANGCA